MIALAGKVKGNSVILVNDDIDNYDGKTFIVTFLDQPVEESGKQIDRDSYSMEKDVISGCDLFLTNGKQLKQFTEIECVTVEELNIL